MLTLRTAVGELTRVGKTAEKRLARLGVRNAKDLLFYFPFRHEDYSRVVKIADLRDGESVTVKVRVELLANRRTPRKRKMLTEALVSDDSGSLRVVWFNQPFIARVLRPGDEIFLSGKARSDMLGQQFISPVYEKAGQATTTHTARLAPIYSLTGGLTQKQMRFLTSQIIGLADSIPEWLPEEISRRFDLTPLPRALRGIHFPADETDLRASAERLKFGELFLLQMRAELARQERSALQARCLEFKENEMKEFVDSLPFVLTKAQKVAAWEILRDLEKTAPMNRLLSGDVGSGKTVVAAMAMHSAVLNGHQAVLMAPTEILARQHYDSLCRLYSGLKLNVGLLTRSQAENFQFPISNFQFSKAKKCLLENIVNGLVDIAVGTHALLSAGVEFKNLGLVIVDEQHRFGVEQRRTMKEKGADVHFLSMTATPIPRSLALLTHGDLDLSVIDEMPPGRKKTITRLVEPLNRNKAYDFIRAQVKKGRQAFVICPLIEIKTEDNQYPTCLAGRQVSNIQPALPAGRYQISNLPCRQAGIKYPASDKKSVLNEYQKLSKDIFSDLSVGYLHGRMRPKEKEETMQKFRERKTDILVSTSVVEVGMDIPNASVMMIEGAERFGLAQLHQFRGRVGRAEHQSYCLLFTDTDASPALERMKFFEKENDGFKLAAKDLEMRGPGEVYGTEQSGLMNLRLAKLTDRDIIKKAREAAKMVSADLARYPLARRKFSQWEKGAHLE